MTDLMRVPLLGRLLRGPWLQRLVQLVLLAAYAALIAIGLGRDGIPGVPELHPRMYTHATTLLFWVLWLMGLVFLAPLTARAWCTVCPLGYLSDVIGRRGLGLRWPSWIRHGWGALLLFGLGVVAVVAYQAHRSPHRTALVIAAIGAVAVLAGAVWRRSAFCRGLCPVGAVLHLYSRCAPLRVLPVNADGCGDCSRAGCVDRQLEWRRWDAGRWTVHRQVSRGGCPVALYPPQMDTGACLLCLRCVRSCPQGNLGVFWGAGAEPRPLGASRLVMLGVVLGLVGFALLRTWPQATGWLTPGFQPAPDLAALWLVLGVPSVLLLGPALLGGALRKLRGRPVADPGTDPRPPPRAAAGADTGLHLGERLIPWIGPLLGAHAALALVKLNAKGGYLPYLFYDPQGASTYLAITVAKTLPAPDLLLPLGVLRWLALGCFAVGTGFGVRQACGRWRGSDGPEVVLLGVSMLATVVLLGGTLVHWLF